MQYLYKVDNGFYLDIGANEPDMLSVTKMFYDAGWSGINVEPLPTEHKKLVDARPRDINILAAAGSAEKKQTLYVWGRAGVLSTLRADMARKNRGLPRHTVSVKNTTALAREAIDLEVQPIHFCKIDVEGYEGEVLRGIDFKVLRPWIFVIEANRDLVTRKGETFPVWQDILLNNGYTYTETDKLNRYYVDNNRPELIKQRLSRADVLSMYDITSSMTKKKIPQ
ncbi:MAG: FkbM family methyltransferase [Oscillospiraceae bacterium]|nr:FkbM family methyltransferase [Oscillospiraceae bacterium]